MRERSDAMVNAFLVNQMLRNSQDILVIRQE